MSLLLFAEAFLKAEREHSIPPGCVAQQIIADPNVKYIKTLLYLTSGLSLLLLLSCCRMIPDDLSSCPQGMEFAFSSRTECGTTLPLDRMKMVMIQVYDSRGELVSEYTQKDVAISSGYKLFIPFSKPGVYTFSFWGMEKERYYSRTQGASCALKKELIPVKALLPALYYGSLKEYVITDRSDKGTQIDLIEINMLPYTYNFNIEVTGLLNDTEHTLEIADRNGAYDYLGKMLEVPVVYIREKRSEDGRINVSLNTLKLKRNGATLIRIKQNESGKTLLEIPLEEILLGIEKANGIKINPECLYDFNLKLEILTHQSIRVTVNQWNFVYRTVILS